MASAKLSIDIWTGKGQRLARDPRELAEAFVPLLEHVCRLAAQGYQAGEICDDNFRGWWKIERED